MKVIKIFSQSQLILLRNINPLLGRYRLPKRILKKMEYILESENFGRQGFLIVIATPVKNDICEIEDAVNVYPCRIKFLEEIEGQDIQEMQGEIHFDAKNREWFLEKLYVQETDSFIYVLYFILKKDLYENPP